MGWHGGERIGRWSLRLDAAYCAVLGTAVAFAAPVLTDAVRLPVWTLIALGVAVIAWAVLILVMMARMPLRSVLRVVMVVNLLAAAVIAAVSGVAATVLVVLAILAIAVDVALFAGSQFIALRRLRPVA